MIGNTIRYMHYYFINNTLTSEERVGLVVDAFTEVKGTVSGSVDMAFGFGSGSTSGSTKSNRVYKVMFYEKYDTEKKLQKFDNVKDNFVSAIIEFANNSNQEKNEEKFINP